MKNIFLAITLFLAITNSLLAQEKKWTLEECVKYALTHNIALQQSNLDAQMAGISKKDALGRFLPSINAQTSHSWNIGLNQNITTGLLENQTTQFTSAGLNVGFDIYKGLQNQNQMRKANLAIIAAQYQTTKMQEDVSLNVVNAYLQILFCKENLKIQQQQLEQETQQFNKIQELVTVGSLPKGDLLEIKATIAVANQRLIMAQNNLLIARLSLTQLLQLQEYTNFDIAETTVVAPESTLLIQEPSAIVAKAKQVRTDIKIAQINLQIAEKDIKIAQGTLQPSVHGFYSFTTRASNAKRYQATILDTNNPTTTIGYLQDTGQLVIRPNMVPVLGNPEPLFDQFDNNKGHSLGLQVTIPILNGFAAQNNLLKAKIGLEKNKIALQKQEQDLEKAVITAYTDTKGAQKTYQAAEITYTARQKAADYAKEKYAVGLINAFDYSQVQNLLINAQAEVLKAKYDYIFRTKILEFYFGIPIVK